MTLDMNRRSFLQLASAFGVAAAVPVHIVNEVEAAVETVDTIPPSSHGLFVFDGRRWIRGGDLMSVTHQITQDVVSYFDYDNGLRKDVLGIKGSTIESEINLSGDMEFHEYIRNNHSARFKVNIKEMELLFDAHVDSFYFEHSAVDLDSLRLDLRCIGTPEMRLLE